MNVILSATEGDRTNGNDNTCHPRYTYRRLCYRMLYPSCHRIHDAYRDRCRAIPVTQLFITILSGLIVVHLVQILAILLLIYT